MNLRVVEWMGEMGEKKKIVIKIGAGRGNCWNPGRVSGGRHRWTNYSKLVSIDNECGQEG